MKVNNRRKDKWTKDKEFKHESSSEYNRKMLRREKHTAKNKRLHQYNNLRDLFDDAA
jgi:hypothetical protein